MFVLLRYSWATIFPLILRALHFIFSMQFFSHSPRCVVLVRFFVYQVFVVVPVPSVLRDRYVSQYSISISYSLPHYFATTYYLFRACYLAVSSPRGRVESFYGQAH